MRHGAEFDDAGFVAALLDPSSPPPVGLARSQGASVERRFRVYRNNVVAGLIDALELRFPVCARLVGAEFFRAAAAVFVRRSPPRTPMLAEYGEAFPAFLESFEPARELTYLADVARLEYAIGQSYHAADAMPLQPDAFAAFPPERLGDAVFLLHPSVQLLTSAYPIVSIWRMNALEAETLQLSLGAGEDAMVVRPECGVDAIRLPAGGYSFLTRLAEGQTFSCAAAGATADCQTFDLTGVLAILISRGAVVSVEFESARLREQA